MCIMRKISDPDDATTRFQVPIPLKTLERYKARVGARNAAGKTRELIEKFLDQAEPEGKTE